MTIAARTAARSPALAIRDLIGLTKPRITLMVMLTAAGGLWLAPSTLGVLESVLVLVAIAAVVGAANTLNCWYERDIDKHMERTKLRPLPAERLDPRTALALGIGLMVVSVPVLTLLTNLLTGALGVLALGSYVLIYTPMKQKSPNAVLVGAVPGALPPLMGWTAATGELGAPGLALFGLLFFWQLPHVLAISIFREREYARAGIRVMPLVHGRAATKRHATLYAVLLVPVSLALIPLGIAGWFYGVVAGVLGIAFLALTASGFWAEQTDRWARRVFFASLLYLPLVLGALALDVAF